MEVSSLQQGPTLAEERIQQRKRISNQPPLFSLAAADDNM
jgi:hypothetical protein